MSDMEQATLPCLNKPAPAFEAKTTHGMRSYSHRGMLERESGYNKCCCG